MRYIFISDIHGEYDKMIKALDGVSFDKDTDTIIMLGDAFDRGPKSKEILEYLLGLPHRILVEGNHEQRLYELLMKIGYDPNECDVSNGVLETLKSFSDGKLKSEYPMNSTEEVMSCLGDYVRIKLLADNLHDFMTDPDYENVRNELRQYFNELVWGVEFDDLVGVHAWTPLIMEDKHVTDTKLYDYDWNEATWENTLECIVSEAPRFNNKPYIVGHFHSVRIRSYFKKFDKTHKYTKNDFKTFITPNKQVIAIDGCSNHPDYGVVNAYVKESDKEPIIYGKQTKLELK
jgi:3',5'-cyclic AMP phosphodiesterase CpdA